MLRECFTKLINPSIQPSIEVHGVWVSEPLEELQLGPTNLSFTDSLHHQHERVAVGLFL